MTLRAPAVFNEAGQRVGATPVIVVGSDGSDRATQVKDVIMTLDTSAYASGDVLADTQTIAGAFRAADSSGSIQTLMVIDKDDQKAAFTIFFLDANVTFGAENGVPSISDADGASILGYVDVAAADYRDLGGVSVACIKGIGLPVKSISGTDQLAIAIINGTGAPTFTAAGVVVRLGMLVD